jgi:hypothetical protein
VLGQSGGAERRHHLVKFELKPVVCIVKFDVSDRIEKKKKKCRENFERSRVAAAGVERMQSVCIMQLEQ